MAVIGVDLGGTKLAGVLLDSVGRVLGQIWRAHQVGAQANAVDVLSQGIGELLDLADHVGLNVDGVGVSIAGWLDVARQHVVSAANLALTGSDLQRELEQRHGIPVLIGNDGDCTLLGELTHGAAVGVDHAVLLTLGTGVGGGILVDGRLLVGSRGIAGELGHTPVFAGVDPSSFPVCVCGGQGCLEQQTSGVALGAAAERLRRDGTSAWLAAFEGRVTARELGSAARDGCAAAVAVVEQAGSALAAAVRIFIPTLNPAVVVLGGSVMEGLGDLLVPLVQAGLAAAPYPVSVLYPPPQVRAASGPRNVAAVGAAGLFTATR